MKSSGDRGFRVSRTSESFVFAPRGRDSSYFGLFSILGAVWLIFNALRGGLAVFSLRGYLEKLWVMGIVPYLTLYNVQFLRLIFG